MRSKLLGVLLLIATPAWALEVWIASPPAGTPALGKVEVVAGVESSQPLRVVELLVDGRFRGRRLEPPYVWLVDLGERNLEHRFEVLATDVSGERASAVLVTPQVRIDDTVEVELQQLYVTVSRDGQAVHDLRRQDFTVVDSGQRQELVTFERGDVPLTAVLLLDASDSMRGERLRTALASTRAFIDGMQPLDQAMLLLFADRVIHATPFTGFRQVLAAGLEEVVGAGGTALNDHLYISLKLLEVRQGRRVVILLSDGIDSASVLAMRQALWAARRSQALVYWLRLGGSDDERLSFSSAWRDADAYRREFADLEEVVGQSGGQILPLEGLQQAAAAFSDILDELRGQYVLGYYPRQRSDDGRWRPVRVLVSRPGFKVRARKGYVDY
jgi:Ca-activated chloride channel family protein